MSDQHQDHESPLDATVIASLMDLGGEPLLAELVDLFCADAPSQMAELQEAAREGDAARIAAAAHSLKSSCANLGAVRLAELSRQLELAGRAGTIESAADVIELSRVELERVSAALKEHLS